MQLVLVIDQCFKDRSVARNVRKWAARKTGNETFFNTVTKAE